MKNNNNNNNDGVPGPAGGRNKTVPADTVDTLRGRRKGDPQHKVVGKKKKIAILERKKLKKNISEKGKYDKWQDMKRGKLNQASLEKETSKKGHTWKGTMTKGDPEKNKSEKGQLWTKWKKDNFEK